MSPPANHAAALPTPSRRHRRKASALAAMPTPVPMTFAQRITLTPVAASAHTAGTSSAAQSGLVKPASSSPGL